MTPDFPETANTYILVAAIAFFKKCIWVSAIYLTGAFKFIAESFSSGKSFLQNIFL